MKERFERIKTSAVCRMSLVRKIRSKNADSRNPFGKIITVHRERNFTQANLLKAGFISVYNALTFGIDQIIF